MITISVCIGSGCHLKGSHQIIEQLKQLIQSCGEVVEVKLAASFCQGHCTEGVAIKFNEELLTNVTPENIASIFAERVSRLEC